MVAEIRLLLLIECQVRFVVDIVPSVVNITLSLVLIFLARWYGIVVDKYEMVFMA